MSETSGPVERRAFRITGRVQGVFFRAWTREAANELGLLGTVKNLPDRSVEAIAEGPAEILDTFESRLWEGPPASRVEGVERLDTEAGGSFESFEIRY